ncbi:hypothetical protein ACKVEX_05540 [Rhodocyclaceae bacterium SMB388]
MQLNRSTIPPQWRHEGRPFVGTDEAADLFGVKPHTLRVSLCRRGHYCGVVPLKAPNRMLRWPVDQIEKALSGEVA